MFQELGKVLIILGLFLVVLGSFFYVKIKIPFLGHLPGDILIKKDNFVFYFPLTTSIVISLIIMLISYLLNRS